MATLNAQQAGTFALNGQLTINRLGFGAMRITGQGVWGAPSDPGAARRTLARLPELGVNLIDTADSYGPFVSEQLIHDVLHPYDGLHIATKAGMVRTGPDQWEPVGRPEYLRQQALMSCRRLGVESIDLWQLHRVDKHVPRDEQFDAIKSLIDDGLIVHAGLSEVSVDDIDAATAYFDVATVQNLYNITERRSEDVLTYCEQHDIGFIPWFPLAAGKLSQVPALADIARAHDASVHQIALAWLLQRSPVMLPIPGTTQVAHLEDNVAAAAITLTDNEMAALTDGL